MFTDNFVMNTLVFEILVLFGTTTVTLVGYMIADKLKERAARKATVIPFSKRPAAPSAPANNTAAAA